MNLTSEQQLVDSIYRTMRETAGMEPKGFYDFETQEKPMKTYTPEQLADVLGLKVHQVHYLWRRGLIPKPILPVPNARWNAEHVDYYLKHGMQKFQEVYA